MKKGRIRLVGLFAGIIGVEFVIAGLFLNVESVPALFRTVSLVAGLVVLAAWIILMRVVGEDSPNE